MIVGWILDVVLMLAVYIGWHSVSVFEAGGFLVETDTSIAVFGFVIAFLYVFLAGCFDIRQLE